MSSKRCYGCKCLEEESTTKFYARIKKDPKAKFFCKKCKKNEAAKSLLPMFDDHFIEFCKPLVEEAERKRREENAKYNITDEAKECRRRYRKTDKGKGKESLSQYNYRMRKIREEKKRFKVSDEECLAIGKFYRKRPIGYEVDHIIPLTKKGRHELSNLQYLSKEAHKKKSAKELSDWTKKEISKTNPFTPIPKGDFENEGSSKFKNRISKFKRLRRLVVK